MWKYFHFETAHANAEKLEYLQEIQLSFEKGNFSDFSFLWKNSDAFPRPGLKVEK